jgi:hypothetical protein
VNGARFRIGAMQSVWARWVFSSNGSGILFVTLPEAAVGITASTSGAAGQRIGGWTARDASVPFSSDGGVALATATTARFNRAGFGDLDDNDPWVWASGDILHFHAHYPVA